MTNEQLKSLLDLDPEANLMSLKSQLSVILDGEHTTFDGIVINFDLIYNKYSQYLKYWNAIYGDRDPKYLKSVEQKVNISSFLMKNMYEQQFIIPKKKRDIYLFGDLSINYLNDKLNEFYKLIQYAGRKKEIQAPNTEKPF